MVMHTLAQAYHSSYLMQAPPASSDPVQARNILSMHMERGNLQERYCVCKKVSINGSGGPLCEKRVQQPDCLLAQCSRAWEHMPAQHGPAQPSTTWHSTTAQHGRAQHGTAAKHSMAQHSVASHPVEAFPMFPIRTIHLHGMQGPLQACMGGHPTVTPNLNKEKNTLSLFKSCAIKQQVRHCLIACKALALKLGPG